MFFSSAEKWSWNRFDLYHEKYLSKASIQTNHYEKTQKMHIFVGLDGLKLKSLECVSWSRIYKVRVNSFQLDSRRGFNKNQLLHQIKLYLSSSSISNNKSWEANALSCFLTLIPGRATAQSQGEYKNRRDYYCHLSNNQNLPWKSPTYISCWFLHVTTILGWPHCSHCLRRDRSL